MADTYDAVIIGAGIIGAAVGYELAKDGKRTLNVDALPAAGYGSTSNSCAIIRVHYSTVDATALAAEAYYDWLDWKGYLGPGGSADESGLAAFHATGCLVMKTEHNGRLERNCAILDELSIPYEHWSPDAILKHLPLYDLKSFFPPKTLGDEAFGEPTGGAVEGGVFFPTAGYISDPQLATHNIQRAAEAHGAEFRLNAKVTAIPTEGGRIAGIELEDGTVIEAPIVVNVAGPHSDKVNRLAGAEEDMKIGTRALRQEVVHLPVPGFDFENHGLVVSDSDIACYCRPEAGNHIPVGSEDPECDEREWVDPDDFERSFTEQWTVQARRMGQRIPTLPVTASPKGVVDLYDVSDDWLPIYDRSQIPGYYMAVGTSGNQFKNAPTVGRMMADLIQYCEAGGDHDTEPMTFDLPRIGHKLDMGSFSRRREITAESSFSVLG